MRSCIRPMASQQFNATLAPQGRAGPRRSVRLRPDKSTGDAARAGPRAIAIVDVTAFERRVLSIVARIPVGRVTTYGDVARLAGKPRAARAVGNIMRQADRPGLPYHRVIAAGGQLGGYTSLSMKRSLLAAEGLTVTSRRVVGFARVRWPK